MRLPQYLLSLLACLAAASPLLAQDFLRAGYAGPSGKPAQLNVCGDTDVSIYRIQRQAGAPSASGVVATVHLFEGIRAVSLDPARSSPGVSVVSLDDPSAPVISLPDIGSANPRVDFALVLEATCGVLDTITANNLVEVRDSLSIAFAAVGQARTESHVIDPYIGAVTFPVFTLSTGLDKSPLRVGEVVTRSVEVANGSFRGYADTVLYELRQGPGATVTAMAVNGTPVPFGKTVTPAGDTLVTLLLSGEAFRQNRDGGGLGNGDTRFDPDERLVITETLRVLNCTDARIARHTTRFGCEGRYCAVATVQSDLPIGSGQPELRYSKPAAFPDVQAGYCQRGEMTLWVTNRGRETDATFGQARDIAVSALASFGSLVAANNYRIADVEVAGVRLPEVLPVVDLDAVPAFATDPDGAGRGLEDYDGDGVYDDLALLDSFPVKIYYEFDCSTSAAYDLDENCANDAATTFQSFVYFENACGRELQGSEPSVYSPRNVQDDFEQRTQPDAFAEGAPFRVELEFGRLVFDFANACRDDGELRAYVVLPQGVTIDAGTSQLSRGSTVGMPLLGVTMAGDTAMLRFDPSAEPALNGEYTLTLGLMADCTAPLGETVYPTTVAYYCPTCDCEHIWICEEIVGPWIHKTAPPCQAAELYPCPNGVQGTRFQIDRTTLGFADPDFQTRIDEALVNTKVALPADSVLIQIDGTVGDAVLTDDLGVVLHYFTPTEEIDTAGLFLLNGGTLEWDDGGTTRSCDVGLIAHTLESNPADVHETWQRFDLSACLAANGWNVAPGDAIRFRGNFEINPAGPIKDEYEFVEDLRGGFYAVDGVGVETVCDQFGDIFRVGRPLSLFGTPSNDQYPKGCDPSQIEFKLSSVNRGYEDEFGREYRRAARLDSLVIAFDTSLFSAFGDFSAELLVAEHPDQGSTYFPVRPLTDFPDGRYVLQLDTLNYSAELVTNHTQLYSLRFTLAPNCSSVRASANGDARYAMRSEASFRDRYYARDIGDGSRVLPVEDPRDFVVTYEDPAVLRMDQLTPSYQRIVNDSAYVEIEVCNVSTVSDAARSWLTFDDTTALSVEEVVLLDDVANPRPLAILPYADGHYVNVEGLARVNGANTTAQVCNLFRVKVRAMGCETNSVVFGSGWGCEPTVPAGWTPGDDAACIDDRVLTTFEPIAPFLEADLVGQPTGALTLCTRVDLDFQVNNAEPGTSYDVLSQFYVPMGFTYVAGSAQVAYPPSAAFVPTVNDLAPTTNTVRGLGMAFGDLDDIHPYLGERGLPGFDAASPSDSSRYVVRLSFETDCEFRSGSLVFFEAQGDEACGDRTNLAATESASLVIDGTEPDGTHLYDVTVAPTSRISTVSAVSTLEVAAVNQGTEPTDTADVIEVTLPQNLRYEPGSVVAVLPQGYLAPEPTVGLRGAVQTLEFALPTGMLPGEAARLRFDVRAAPVPTCGDVTDVAIAAYRFVTAGCVNPGRICRIPTDITVGGARIEAVPVGAGIAADFVSNESTCDGVDAERLDLDVVLGADGFAFDGAPVTVALYFDATGNAVIDAGDELISTQSLANAPGDTEIRFVYGGIVARDRLAGLFLVVEEAGTELCEPQTISVPSPRLNNASEEPAYDVCLTDGNTVQLGVPECAGATGVGFAWTSLPAGYEAFLDDASAPRPTVTIPTPHTGPQTIRFVLESTRAGQASTTDTVALTISGGVELDGDSERTITSGAQVILQPGVLSGQSPLSYLWSPAGGLSGATEAQPIASPSTTTVYTLVVTDALGCSASNTHTINVDAPIVADANFVDTTICPGATVEVRVTGGPDVSWEADPGNPADGDISAYDERNVTFDPGAGTGVYRFTATVRDPASPRLSDVVTVTIRVETSAACLPGCRRPRLVDEVVFNTSCARPSGAIALTYDEAIADYATTWTDADGTILGTSVLALTDLSPGVYTLRAVGVADPSCGFEHDVYVSATDAPRAVLTATTPASCGGNDGAVTLAAPGGEVEWPDGSTSTSRTDLAAGVYHVASYDAAAPDCRQYLRVEVGQSGGLVIAANVVTAPDCGANNGTVDLSVDGGSGDYSYDWPSGASSQTGLAAGVYNVTVTDVVTGCTGRVAFVLENAGGGVDVLDATPREAACLSAPDGYVAYALDIDSAVALPLDTVWTRDGREVENGGFIAGDYCLLIRDTNGCLVGGECFAFVAPQPIAVDLTLADACGVEEGSASVRQSRGASPLNYILDSRPPTTETTLDGIGPGPHRLVVLDPNGCSASAEFETERCGDCDFFDGRASASYEVVCGDSARVCLPGVTNAEGIEVYLDGDAYPVPLASCAFGEPELAVLLPVGDHDLVVVDAVLACADTLAVSVTCATVPPAGGKVVVYDTIYVNQTGSYCPEPTLGPWSLLSFPDSLTEGGADSAGRCVVYRGLAFGTDTIELRAVAAGDTTPICVILTVAPYDGGVTALPDSTCTARNQPIRLNVLANDEAFGGVASFTIVEPPAVYDGTVAVNADNTVTFTPAEDVCARDVSFVYEVCNGNTDAVGGGCARAEVTVCIECDGLTIFTAVTPNGDGRNDVFWVEGIAEFPNNRLQIFNRWGTIVYETRGYLNEWAGTYLGDPLPAGAYYYLLDVTDAGETKTYNGYVEVIR